MTPRRFSYKYRKLVSLLINTLIVTLVLIPHTLLYAAEALSKPALMLANVYRSDIDLDKYWVSEKYDGVRAFWNGHQLVSRQGNIYQAPNWFIADFPSAAIDGELWMGRGKFDALSGAVRKQNPVESEWKTIRFMAFDLPRTEGSFDYRLTLLKQIISNTSSPYLHLVIQRKFSDELTLMNYLDEVIEAGGEGLMLHLASAPYHSNRSDDLLKLKRHQDAEATVVEHLLGKGKYKGMLGAILVETKEGLRFKIGSGFSDAERETPPPIGSVITYKYYGVSSNGTPRFASFLRLRNEI
ncbi:DNA ligase [Zhongshania aquimaris]|uniref:DNA ligase n=1 Tax=Zhongshania aquimaris TaxID=2857107 RepID=A0ABS6VWU5_9GAMM|nr:DNA ligase [Zhongshania aquimaris]MBW2942829.1 DNA ligase [Zhongshania aquimaris]